MKRLLVTGANGLVGRAVCEAALQSGYEVRASLRTSAHHLRACSESVVVGEIDGNTNWQAAVDGVDFVIHCAGRAHVMHGGIGGTDLYMRTNAEGTHRLALAAADAGVRRLVFVSSIKVNGEGDTESLFSPDDQPRPNDAYGRSKAAGEAHVMEVAALSGMEVAIVRPPLVYGPGVRANFLRLLRWVDRGFPLPFGAIANRRSLVSVWNLSDLLLVLLAHPRAAGKTWMVSDGEDLSTPELIRRIAQAMRRRAKLWAVPPAFLQFCGAVLGQREALARLCGSLAVDNARTCFELGWSPPISVDEGLERTCSWYLTERRRGL